MIKKVLTGVAFTGIALSNQSFAQEINLNGFASMHATQKLGGSSTTEYYDETTNYYNFSKFGLNVGSDLSEKWTVQSQLLVAGKKESPGSNDPQWQMYANWLFVSFKPDDQWRFRLGRQLFPAWLVSEYIDVGYMYPWTETPHAVYELSPFKSLNGASADYTFKLQDNKRINVALFGGQEALTIPLAQGGNEHNNYGSVIGTEISLIGDGYKFRVMGSYYGLDTETTDSTGTNTGSFKNNSVKTVTTGYRYDKDNILVYAEYGFRDGGNGTTVEAADSANGKKRTYNDFAQAGYATIGYWIGNSLPNFTASFSDYTTGTVEGTQDMYSLGYNYKIKPGLMFKSNISYSISNNGPAHMDGEGDATTAVVGFDMIF